MSLSMKKQILVYYASECHRFYVDSLNHLAATAAAKELTAAARAHGWSTRCFELGLLLLRRYLDPASGSATHYDIKTSYHGSKFRICYRRLEKAFALQLKTDELHKEACVAQYTTEQFASAWKQLAQECSRGIWTVIGQPAPTGVVRGGSSDMCQCTGCSACSTQIIGSSHCERPVHNGLFSSAVCRYCKRRACEIYANSKGAQIYFPSEAVCGTIDELQKFGAGLSQQDNRFCPARSSVEARAQQMALSSLHSLCLKRLCSTIVENFPESSLEMHSILLLRDSDSAEWAPFGANNFYINHILNKKSDFGIRYPADMIAADFSAIGSFVRLAYMGTNMQTVGDKHTFQSCEHIIPYFPSSARVRLRKTYWRLVTRGVWLQAASGYGRRLAQAASGYGRRLVWLQTASGYRQRLVTDSVWLQAACGYGRRQVTGGVWLQATSGYGLHLVTSSIWLRSASG